MCTFSIKKNNNIYFSIDTVPKQKFCNNYSDDYIYSRDTHCCYLQKTDINTTLYGVGADFTQLGLQSTEALFLYGLCGVLLGWQFGKNMWGYS